ncbi:tyrosine-type recombinase/integrase [Desulfobacca acetoxidans]
MNIHMRLFKRDNGTWYVELERDKKLSLKTKDAALAQQLFRKIKKEYLHRRIEIIEGKPPQKTLSHFTEEYLEFAGKVKARSTWRTDALALRKLSDYLEKNIPLEKINRQTLDRFLADLSHTVSRTSLHIWFRHLKAAFTKAVEWGYIKANPFKGIRMPAIQKAPSRFLTLEESQKLLEAETDHHFRNLWLFLLLTGCRRSEALQVTRRDIDWELRQITIPRTKNRHPKVVRISQDLEMVLREVADRAGPLFPWTPDAVSHHSQRTVKKAELTKVRLHDLRHTFASHLAMAGVDLYTIKELLGHHEIKTTMIYAHLSSAHLDQALTKLDFATKVRSEDSN